MELLEGESLADRLQKGPLPLDQVVKFGAQVSDALSAAHKQGIVHRDLKPGNVMLTKGGAKLLYFGLDVSFDSRVFPRATSPASCRHSSGLKTFWKPRPAKSLTFAVANSVTP